MSQIGKFLNLHPHNQSWGVYNENGPYTTAYKIGALAPAQFGGLSFMILDEKGGDVYVIQTESYGRCAIWAPVDEDSNITYERTYSNGDNNGSGGGSIGTGTGNGNFLNLKPHMQTWAVYNVDGPYTTAYKIGVLSPAQFGGLSYRILEEKSGDIYIIQTESFGRCAIWAPRDNDSSITSSPDYSDGDTYGGGSTGGSGTYLNLNPHMQSWAVYNVDGPYTSAYKIGVLSPAQFGGLSYRILGEKGGDVYIIQSESLGRCAIWAPRDNDSSITSSPKYNSGDTTGGGSTGGGSAPGGDIGTGDPSFRVFSRYEWGANPIIPSGMSGERTNAFRYIIIHHSAAEQLNSDISQMQSIQNYHQSLDWGDIGYHYGIGKFGMTMQGRETKYIGAHTKGERNSDSIGICLFGNFEHSSPSQFQISSLISLLTLLCKQYGLSPDSIYGHRDFGSTSCPGRYLYAFLPNIINVVRKNINEFDLIKEINDSKFSKSFGVKFSTPYDEIVIAESGCIKIKAQASQDKSFGDSLIVANYENGKLIGGSLKSKINELSVDLSDGLEVALESLFLNLSKSKNVSISISTNNLKTFSASIIFNETLDNMDIHFEVTIEIDRDKLENDIENALNFVADVLKANEKILKPIIIVLTIIALAYYGIVSLGVTVVEKLLVFILTIVSRLLNKL